MEVSKVLKTRRGNTSIFVDGYKLRKIRKFVNGNVKFSCTRKDCHFVCHTTPDYRKVVEVQNDHIIAGTAHPPCSAEDMKMD